MASRKYVTFLIIDRLNIMVQELIDLRQSIIEGRYQDALDIVDELE